LSPVTISLIVCAVLMGGSLAGVLLRRRLPQQHLDPSTKDMVRLGCALVATMSGLVLGLLTNSAKLTFDSQRDEIRQLTASVALLDWLLTKYGPEAHEARVQLREAIAGMIPRIWNDGAVHAAHKAPMQTTAAGESAYEAIRALAAKDDLHRHYRDEALRTATTILQTRLTLYQQTDSGMPRLFLGVLVFWLFVLFASFSLFSPINTTGFAALVLVALCIAGAIFVILEMYQPFSGLVQINSDTLRNVLPQLPA
jgi:hypothetical protein